MENLLSKFTGLYSLSKTLRFELKPVDEFDHNGFINSTVFRLDNARAEAYPMAKSVIDDYHKKFIDESLIRSTIDWLPLYEAIVLRRNSDVNDENSKDILRREQTACRKKIAELFKQHRDWNYLSKDHKKLIDQVLPKFMERTGYDKSIIDVFKGFTTYFTGFHNNRLNMYSDKEQATAVAYRIVHDNFPRFIDNIAVYNHIREHYRDQIWDAEREFTGIIRGYKSDDMFSLPYFNKCLTQIGIDRYNALAESIDRVGIATADGNRSSETTHSRRDQLRIKPLFKQILSEKETKYRLSYDFNNDRELKEGISGYYKLIDDDGMRGMSVAISDLKHCNHNKIYIRGRYIEKLSQLLFDNRDILGEALKNEAEAGAKIKGEDGNNDFKTWVEEKTFVLSNVVRLSNEILSADDNDTDFFNLLTTKTEQAEQNVRTKYEEQVEPLTQSDTPIRGEHTSTEIIKSFLDNCIELYQLVKIFHLGKLDIELQKDSRFYTEDSYRWYRNIANIKALYSAVRSYLSVKAADYGKIKLKFNSPTLANGWDRNKEPDNNVIILMQDNQYYLGIMSPAVKGANRSFVEIPEVKGDEPVYRKMNYKLLPGANKMLPKVFFSQKGIETFHPPQEILDGYKQEQHKKTSGNHEFCLKLIDFYKQAIEEHKDWSCFNFEFKPTDQYEDISEFYKDIERQGYRITFEDVPTWYIDQLTAEKKLFLFQIYNKDFSEHSKGIDNLHTLYWKAIFSDDNLRDVVFKLNGEAEIFYRNKINTNPIVHKRGSKLVNKRYADGSIIPDNIYTALYNYFNDRISLDELNEEEKAALSKAVVKEAKLELIKDRRYTNYKFLFHVPITINFKSGKTNRFNSIVNENFRDYEGDIKVIGLNRGEKHLMYLTLIDGKGNILKNRSFNTVEYKRYDGVFTEFDYNAKLEYAEGDHATPAANWDNNDKIRELKDGYLSQLVHQVAKMMVEERAVLVTEDLYNGFRKGRFKLSNRYYQKFEKMLIDKLNYLVFKDKPDGEASIMQGLQLTPICENVKLIGKQIGWLYYVPVKFTSQICPKTGFVNLFDMKNIRGKESIKEFFAKMNSIVYNLKDNHFEFSFDYANFKTCHPAAVLQWTICTNGTRIKNTKRNNDKWSSEEIDLTHKLKSLLSSRDVEFEDGSDIRKRILSIDAKDTAFYRELLDLFMLSLQIRNVSIDSDVNYVISPVRDNCGQLFDSRKAVDCEPDNPDANSAFHIALKGLMLLERVRSGSNDMIIKPEHWLRYRQCR